LVGKITVGLASYWPCVTYSPPRLSGLRKVEEHPSYTAIGEWHHSTFRQIFLGTTHAQSPVEVSSPNVLVKSEWLHQMAGKYSMFDYCLALFMATLHSRCRHCIFAAVSSIFLLFFFSHLISVVEEWMSTMHVLHMMWPWCEFRMQV